MQSRALPWLQPKGLKLNNSLAGAHELIRKRHGDQIPADQAMLDIAAAAFAGIVVGDFDVLLLEDVVLDFTGAADLRQALGQLRRTTPAPGQRRARRPNAGK
ncbi:hypothetical protein ACWDRB_07255 [Nonomuraea sp. NPDC003707]